MCQWVVGTPSTLDDAVNAAETLAFDAAILDVNLRSGEKSFPIADALAATPEGEHARRAAPHYIAALTAYAAMRDHPDEKAA